MIKLEPEERSPRSGRVSSQSGSSYQPEESAPTEIKLRLVAFRSGEAVHQHPALQPWLDAGWHIRSAVPRVVESGDTKLLVVLERPVFASESPDLPASFEGV